MNVIGLCQGANLKIFKSLFNDLAKEKKINKTGIFVAHFDFFNGFSKNEKKSFLKQIYYLKEWESFHLGIKNKPNLKIIKEFENKLGAPNLWNGILADRRLQFGRYCKNIQQYKIRFNENQLMGVLSQAIIDINSLFEKVKPDLIFGFVPVTLHEYLIIRLAESLNIKVLLLRSTKIENYLSLNDSLFGLSNHIKKTIANPDAKFSNETIKVANRYMETTISSGAKYEGIHTSDYALRLPSFFRLSKKIAGSFVSEIKRLANKKSRNDNHNPGYLVPALIEEIIIPYRAKKLRVFLRNQKNIIKNLDSLDYCFFPMHFEPEIALQIYARPFQNQIEVIRNLALSLPIGMKLIVKEHPRSAGHRPISFYKKILNIPNVILVGPEHSSHFFVKKSKIVAIITGNIGMEAILLKKPLIVLGESEYSEFPNHIQRTCHNLYELSSNFNKILNDYYYDHKLIKLYLNSIIENSVPLDLYSTLLGKEKRESFNKDNFAKQIKSLKKYTLRRFYSN